MSVNLRQSTNGDLDITENVQEDGVSTTYVLSTPEGNVNITENGTYNIVQYKTANVNVSGETPEDPKVFGVDLIHISIPYDEYECTEDITIGETTVKGCRLSSLDEYVSDLQTTSTFTFTGCAMTMDDYGDITTGQSEVHIQDDVLSLSNSEFSSGIVIWTDGDAYLVGLGTTTLNNGFEFFIFKQEPTVPEIDDGEDSEEVGE